MGSNNISFNHTRKDSEISELEKLTATTAIDKEEILLSPDANNPDILAYLNPSIYPEIHVDTKNGVYGYPMTIRVRKKNYSKRGEFSETHLAFIDSSNPFKIHYNKQILLGQDNEFSQCGTEDTRITQVPRDKLPNKIRNEFIKDRIYALTSVAFDGDNPRIKLDLTEDFEKIIPFGIIGPQILYEKAITYLPTEFGYKDYAIQQLAERKKSNSFLISSDVFLPDKDAALEYNYEGNEWNLWHRIEPHIQIARAKNIEDFTNEKYWVNQLENLTDSTVLKAGSKKWNSEKIGLGGPPISTNGKCIAHYHGVEKRKKKNLTQFIYTCALFEYNPQIGKIVSAQKHNYLIPSTEKEDILFGANTEKYITFSTGILKDPNNRDTAIFYSGKGDKKLLARSANLPWALDVLAKPSNRIVI